MKLKKGFIAILVFAIMFATAVANAQEEKESYGMAEITYMMPKIGMEKAFESAEYGNVVLLSPACASWDQYENFEKRGDNFIEVVKTLV